MISNLSSLKGLKFEQSLLNLRYLHHLVDLHVFEGRVERHRGYLGEDGLDGEFWVSVQNRQNHEQIQLQLEDELGTNMNYEFSK